MTTSRGRTPARRRDTYKYEVRVGSRVVHRGITNDLDRRSSELRNRWPNSRIRQVGNRTTRDGALKWERRVVSRSHRSR
jgi:hypothetical protein